MATDFSESSAVALRWAADLAKQLEVPLVVSHVVAPVAVPTQWQSHVAEVDKERSRQAQSWLEALVAPLKGNVECEAVVTLDRTADSIASIAEAREVGLIVMGLLVQGGARASRPGSVAYRLLSLSHVPVLVVPAQSGAE